MVQNRNKLIELFIGNISNYIVHKILEKAIDDRDIAFRYDKESINSFNIAKKYREKISPINKPLLNKDFKYIKNKIINRVKNKLNLRILKGYKNINFDLIEIFIDEVFNKLVINK